MSVEASSAEVAAAPAPAPASPAPSSATGVSSLQFETASEHEGEALWEQRGGAARTRTVAYTAPSPNSAASARSATLPLPDTDSMRTPLSQTAVAEEDDTAEEPMPPPAPESDSSSFPEQSRLAAVSEAMPPPPPPPPDEPPADDDVPQPPPPEPAEDDATFVNASPPRSRARSVSVSVADEAPPPPPPDEPSPSSSSTSCAASPIAGKRAAAFSTLPAPVRPAPVNQAPRALSFHQSMAWLNESSPPASSNNRTLRAATSAPATSARVASPAAATTASPSASPNPSSPSPSSSPVATPAAAASALPSSLSAFDVLMSELLPRLRDPAARMAFQSATASALASAEKTALAARGGEQQIKELQGLRALLMSVDDGGAIPARSAPAAATTAAVSAPPQPDVAALQSRTSDLELMLGTASLTQKRHLAKIATLERTLIDLSQKAGGFENAVHPHAHLHANSSNNNNSAAAQQHTQAAGSASSAAASSGAPSSFTAALSYPASFEANLAMFLGGGIEDVSAAVARSERAAEDEAWGWSDAAHLPPSAPVYALDMRIQRADSDVSLPVRRAAASAVTSLLKTPHAQLLFPCPRLGVGLELCFTQLHTLVYMQAVSAMHLHVP